MSKVAFFNISARSHINPTFSLVKELVKCGEEVFYYSSHQFSRAITGTGASFRSYGESFNFDLRKISGNILELAIYLMKLSQDLLEGCLLSTIKKERPDYIIHDQLCVWGKHISQILGIPAISSTITFALNRRCIFDYLIFNRLRVFHRIRVSNLIEHMGRLIYFRRFYGITVASFIDLLTNFEPLNIVHTSRYFQPYAERFNERFIFVGPSIESQNEPRDNSFSWERTDGKLLVYISLGTIFNQNFSFYKECFDALKNSRYQVVLSVGDKIPLSAFQDIPNNFIVENYVPQVEVLKRTNVFVTHGGMNSVNEALYFHVPLVVIPQGADQSIVANRVEKLGAGIFIKNRSVSAQTLRNAIERVLSNGRYRANCKKVGDSLRQTQGMEVAIREIFGFKKRNNIC